MSNSKKDIAIAELRTFLEEAYPIGKITAIESITCDEEELLRWVGSLPEARQLGAGELRSSFRVSTEQKEYFLKRVREWVKDDQLGRIEHFIKWTVEQNLSLSPALITTRARESHVKFEGIHFQLFDFVKQDKRQIWMSSSLDENDCHLAGRLLAQFNEAALDYLFQSRLPHQKSSFPPSDEWAESIIDFVRVNWNRLIGSVLQSGDSANPVLVRLLRSREILENKLDHSLHLAWEMGQIWLRPGTGALVHGDFHPGNILFSKNDCDERTVWLVDYDYMHREYSMFDAGYAVIMFSYRPRTEVKTSTAIGVASIDFKMARAFFFGFLQSLGFCELVGPDDQETHRAEHLNRARPDVLVGFMNIACFLIIDWAEERLRNGPPAFSDIYANIVADMTDLLLGEDLERAGALYLDVMKEILN